MEADLDVVHITIYRRTGSRRLKSIGEENAMLRPPRGGLILEERKDGKEPVS